MFKVMAFKSCYVLLRLWLCVSRGSKSKLHEIFVITVSVHLPLCDQTRSGV